MRVNLSNELSSDFAIMYHFGQHRDMKHDICLIIAVNDVSQDGASNETDCANL